MLPNIETSWEEMQNIHGNVIYRYQMIETYGEMLLKLSEVNSLHRGRSIIQFDAGSGIAI